MPADEGETATKLNSQSAHLFFCSRPAIGATEYVCQEADCPSSQAVDKRHQVKSEGLLWLSGRESAKQLPCLLQRKWKACCCLASTDLTRLVPLSSLENIERGIFDTVLSTQIL